MVIWVVSEQWIISGGGGVGCGGGGDWRGRGVEMVVVVVGGRGVEVGVGIFHLLLRPFLRPCPCQSNRTVLASLFFPEQSQREVMTSPETLILITLNFA